MRALAAALAGLAVMSSAAAIGREKAIHAFRWRDDAGACQAPAPFRPWSWDRIQRVAGLPDDKTVVFTVDGGLVPEALSEASAQLRALDVRATFFLMTGPLAKSPRGQQIVAQLVADGHELGNHTVNHPHLTRLPDERLRAELADAERWIAEAAGGGATPLFREPFLDRDARTDRIAAELCLKPVGFTVYTRDDRPGVTASEIAGAVLRDRKRPRELASGAILMFHASQPENRRAWPYIVAELRRRGHRFVPLGEALRSAAAGEAQAGASEE